MMHFHKDRILLPLFAPLRKERITAALLERLTCKGHTLEYIGESSRFRQRLRLEEQRGLGLLSPPQQWLRKNLKTVGFLRRLL